MTTTRQKMDEARAKLRANPEAVKEIGAIYKFVLSGEDGGTWLIDLKGMGDIVEGDGEADCVIRMTAEDYIEMREGRADPQQLFFAQRLQVEGDLGLAMKLQGLNQLLG